MGIVLSRSNGESVGIFPEAEEKNIWLDYLDVCGACSALVICSDRYIIIFLSSKLFWTQSRSHHQSSWTVNTYLPSNALFKCAPNDGMKFTNTGYT